MKREIFERGHAAVCYPLTLSATKLYWSNRFSIAAYDTSETPWLLEMVAGMIEEGRNR